MDLKMVIIALVLGVLFGFALNKAGLTRYTKIVNQFRLTDMAVLKFMMTALVVTMLGVYPMRELGWITFPTIPATYVVGNLVGGLIFGVGMALAGFCPGTAVAGRRGHLRSYLYSIHASDLKDRQLRQCGAPRPVAHQPVPGHLRLHPPGAGSVLCHRPPGPAPQGKEGLVIPSISLQGRR